MAQPESLPTPPDTVPDLPPRVPDPLPWADGTQLCRTTDPDTFFPTDHRHADRELSPNAAAMFAAARRLCRRCPLQDLCLEHALTQKELGVWGGTSETTRKRYRQQGAERDRELRARIVADETAGNHHLESRRAGRLGRAA